MSERKVAIVTGASRGIGKAIALQLAQDGFNIIGIGRSVESASGPAKEIEAFGVEYTPCGVDVSKEEEVEKVVKDVMTKYDRIDVLVNNAGITKDTLLMRMTSEDWDAVLGTNLKGAFFWIRPVSRIMLKARAGRIINIASVIGLHGNAGQANYAAAKAGLIGLTKSAAKELASRGVTCNAVCPGFIQTDMTDVLSEEIKSGIIKNIPLQRFGKGEDVAKVVSFLASEGSGYITGQALTVDGGL